MSNYRDYMFKKYERFAYTPDDCKQLAEAVRKYVVPLKEKVERAHREELNIEDYRPWDIEAVPAGQSPLKPVEHTNQLVKGTTTILNKLVTRFSNLLETMERSGTLDLESRKGKAQGGFCEPLPLSKLSFIFMNASNTHDDVVTLLHEIGRCIHDDLKKDIRLKKYREVRMETAELASMTMELLTMDDWHVFYSNEDDLKRAALAIAGARSR